MKETLFTRHRSTVEPMMIAKDRKTTLQAIHTMAVNQAVTSRRRNVVLHDRPPLINISEQELTRKERTTLAQLRSGHCRFLGSYKSRISLHAVERSQLSGKRCENCVDPYRTQHWGPDRFTVFWARRPFGPAGWLALLLIKAANVETNPKSTAYKRWNCHVIRHANCCHLIPSNCFRDDIQCPSQFAAAKLTHYSMMLHRPSDSS